jgi:UDP-N-acetylglucosamine diphosphorylase/glucosamine-1-phosphate N-acetyltransferase
MDIIIMAGGLGKRMKSDIPKVLHLVDGIPMIVRVLKESKKIVGKNIYIVVGKYKNIIRETIKNYISLENISFIDQPIPMGTGHAIQCCIPYLKNNNKILILSGDTPLISHETIKDMQNISENKNIIMTTILDNPFMNGRIIRDYNNNFIKIVEEKDCNIEEKKINEVNCGIYIFQFNDLEKYIMKIKNNNAQKEYYLPDVLNLMKKDGHHIDIFKLNKEKQHELININTKEQLDELNLFLRKK